MLLNSCEAAYYAHMLARRRAKIVCTLGPASRSQEAIDQLVAAGLDCARLNFSHGSHEDHRKVAEYVRTAASKARRPLALLADLSGPKMRVGKFKDGQVTLKEGSQFVLTNEEMIGDASRATMSYAHLPRDARAGDAILLDDGLLRLRVLSTTETDVITEVEVGGVLSDRKGVNLPGISLSTPAVTDKDKADLAFAVNTLKVDYIALSFVRRAQDIEDARKLSGDVPIIAKIEKPEAVEALLEIIDASDGIMVARGDLGVELGAEKVPLQQKRIIKETNLRGKVVITATQMLDSMIRNPRPTRAEAADVANAVMDGTDAVMLSAETAAGKYPVESVAMMSSIIEEVEKDWVEEQSRKIRDRKFMPNVHWEFAESAARAAAAMSTHLSLKAIITFTRTGHSAALLSEHRPRAPIIAVTHDPSVAQQNALRWGVTPRVEVPPEDLSEVERIASSLMVREKLVTRGDAYLIVCGWPVSGNSNSLRLVRV